MSCPVRGFSTSEAAKGASATEGGRMVCVRQVRAVRCWITRAQAAASGARADSKVVISSSLDRRSRALRLDSPYPTVALTGQRSSARAVAPLPGQVRVPALVTRPVRQTGPGAHWQGLSVTSTGSQAAPQPRGASFSHSGLAGTHTHLVHARIGSRAPLVCSPGPFESSVRFC